MGVQFHGTWSSYTDAQREKALTRLAAMGADWVRIDIGWTMMQPQAGRIDPQSWGVQFIDKVVRMAHSHGLKVLGTLWLTPDWARPRAGERSAPANPKTYAHALQWAAAKWKGVVQAWEVWNEPNSSDFFVGANPVTYTRLLCAAYRAVNSSPASRSVRVVYGGTMHVDVPWIDKTYRAGAKGCYDVMAVHPYQVPGDLGPAAGNGSQVWEFEHLAALHRVMVRHHDRKPVWATELGWSSHRNTASTPDWAKGVTTKQQSKFSVQALNMLDHRYRFVKKAFFYSDRANPSEGVHQAGYGILQNNLSPKPVYYGLQRWARSH
jgi:polysaccharide biosynthesis protein PslG